jgi:hypothetical protein
MYLLSSITSLYAYDDDILNIYSKMLPRFILMSSQKEKVSDKIEICILHDAIDDRDAALLMDKINSNYPNGIKSNKIKLLSTGYNDLQICKNTQSAFLFNSNDKNIKKAILFLKRQKILSISYDAQLLEDGAEISLFIGRKVQPYINVQEILHNNIKLDNILLRVSKIYSKSEQ